MKPLPEEAIRATMCRVCGKCYMHRLEYGWVCLSCVGCKTVCDEAIMDRFRGKITYDGTQDVTLKVEGGEEITILDGREAQVRNIMRLMSRRSRNGVLAKS